MLTGGWQAIHFLLLQILDKVHCTAQFCFSFSEGIFKIIVYQIFKLIVDSKATIVTSMGWYEIFVDL